MRRILNITFICLLVLITISTFSNPVSAAKEIILTVDVWTSKGGQGLGAPGGSYNIGEQVVIYAKSSVSCVARMSIMGPGGTTSGQISLPTNAAQSFSLGVAEQRDIGMWQVKLEAAWEGQYDSDVTAFTVVGAPIPKISPPTSQPPGTSPQISPPSSSTQPGTKTLAKVSPDTADEFLALLTLRMTEGLLTGDPNMDANKDGKVTIEDVHLILQWSVDKATGGGTSQQPSGTGGTGGASQQPSGTVGTKSSSGGVSTQALEAKWQMTRLNLEAPFPKEVPSVLIDQFFPKTGTWEIKRDGGDLKTTYDGRNTWYDEPLFIALIWDIFKEGSTTAQVRPDGLGCTYQTPVNFYFEKSPVGDLRELKGSFTSTVTISVSGNTLNAVCTITGVNGTFQVTEKDGSTATRSINFAGLKATYEGIKK